MATIPLSPQWRIVSDERCWRLEQLIERKAKRSNDDHAAGEAYDAWQFAGYYGRLEHLADALLNKHALGSEAMTVQVLVAELRELRDEIAEMLVGATKGRG